MQAREAINRPIQAKARVELAESRGPFMEPGNTEGKKHRIKAVERHTQAVLENSFVQRLVKLTIRPLQFIQSLEVAVPE